MIQGRARADDSPVGSFDATGKSDYQPQCSGDVSIQLHLDRVQYCCLYRQLLLTLTEVRKLQLNSHGRHHLLVLERFALG